jgi:hypothetical protein
LGAVKHRAERGVMFVPEFVRDEPPKPVLRNKIAVRVQPGRCGVVEPREERHRARRVEHEPFEIDAWPPAR